MPKDMSYRDSPEYKAHKAKKKDTSRSKGSAKPRSTGNAVKRRVHRKKAY